MSRRTTAGDIQRKRRAHRRTRTREALKKYRSTTPESTKTDRATRKRHK